MSNSIVFADCYQVRETLAISILLLSERHLPSLKQERLQPLPSDLSPFAPTPLCIMGNDVWLPLVACPRTPLPKSSRQPTTTHKALPHRTSSTQLCYEQVCLIYLRNATRLVDTPQMLRVMQCTIERSSGWALQQMPVRIWAWRAHPAVRLPMVWHKIGWA